MSRAEIVAYFAVAAWAILPGLPVAYVIAKHTGLKLPATMALSAGVTLSLVGVSGFAGRLLGFDLRLATIIVVVAAIALAVAVAALLRRQETSHSLLTRSGLGLQGVALGLAAGALALYQRPWFAMTTDTFYHLAAARSLVTTGRTMVTDPFHGTAVTGLDATSGILHTWIAMLGDLLPLPLETIFVGVTAMGATVVVLGIWSLADRLSGSPWAATLATVGYVGLTLYSDLRMYGLPNRFSIGIIFVAILMLVELAVGRRPSAAAVGLAAAGFAAAGTHLASAVFIGVVAVALLVWWVVWAIARRHEAGAWSPFKRLAITLGGLAAVVSPLLITKIPAVLSSDVVSAAIPQKARDEAIWFITEKILVIVPGQFVSAGAVAFFAVAIIAIIAAVSSLKMGEREDLPVAAIVSMPALALFNPPVTSIGVALGYYAFARTALLMNFIPWIALAWIVPRAAQSNGRRRIVATLLAVAVLASAIVAQWTPTAVTWVRIEDSMRFGESYTVAESRAADIRNGWGSALWDVKSAVGDSYPIVAADPETGYYLAGLAPVAIVAAPRSHSPLAVELETGEDRRRDMGILTTPETSEGERRVILERWGAEYVALSPGIGFDAPAYESMLEQTELFEPVVESRRLVLLRVLP